MFKEISLLKKRFNKITFLSWVVFMGLNFGNSAIAQTPPPYVPNIPAVVYTPLEEYYSTGSEITCTAKVYSNGLIDKLCAIYYTIYKDDFNTPIPDVEPYGSVSYTVRSKGENYITQNITTGNGYLSVKPLISIYKAFTLGIFDNYCTNRNRPVALSMTFNVPGVYKFNAEIRSCTNGGSSILTNFTVPEGASEGCAPGSHSDKAASSCDNPTALTSDAIFLTICDDNYIAFLSGDTEYCPGEVINLVYTIGGNDDEVDLTLLPEWITPVINQNANTLTLTGVAPDYDPENPIINFDVRILSAINPVGCPGAAVSQSIIITNAQRPVISGSNMICEGGSVILTSDIAATWTSSNIGTATIEQTAPDAEVALTAQNSGTTIITCQEFSSGCNLISDEFVFNVHPNHETIINEAICEGDSYLFGGVERSLSGEYVLNLISQFGCDSVSKLNLTVNPPYHYNEDATICNGETFVWQGVSYSEAGTYLAEYSSVSGCDSIYELTLTLNPTYLISEVASICNGETFVFGGQELFAAGEYTLNLISEFGCDSTVVLTLQVYELSSSEFYIEDESYNWNGIEYAENGDYTQTFVGVNGCDSIVTLHLAIVTDIANFNINKGNINVYPNPVGENLYVDIAKDNNKTYSIVLTDVIGKVLIKKEHVSEKNILNLSHLSGGIYFISIVSDNKILFTTKISKER